MAMYLSLMEAAAEMRFLVGGLSFVSPKVGEVEVDIKFGIFVLWRIYRTP